MNSARFFSLFSYSGIIETSLYPGGGNPEGFGFDPVNRCDQLLEGHREIGVHDHLVEEVGIKELYSRCAVKNFLEFLVLKIGRKKN